MRAAAHRDAPAQWDGRAAWWLLFGGLSIAAAWQLDRLGAGRTFFYDEWSWITERRTGLAALLGPHNGHLVAAPVAVYQLLFALVGLERYRAYLLVGIVVHLACATLTARYTRRRSGDAAGLAAGAVTLFLGSGWETLLWPFQITLVGSLAAGVGALMLLDRQDRRAGAAAAASLVLAVACSGVGLAFIAGAAVRLALERRWQRWYVVAVPAALYLGWLAHYGAPQVELLQNVRALPAYVWAAYASSLAGIAGLDRRSGEWLGVAFLVAVATKVWRARRLSPGLSSLVATALTFWVLTALARGQHGEPGASRYVYVGVVLCLLALSEILGLRRSPWRSAFLLGVALLAISSSWETLGAGAAILHENSVVLRAELAALELTGGRVDEDYKPDPVAAPTLKAGPYFEAIRALGSPAAPLDHLPGEPESARAAADRVLLEVRPPIVAPGNADPRGRLQIDGAGDASCAQTAAGESVTVVVPAGGISVMTPTETRVRLRRFAGTWSDVSPLPITAGPFVLRTALDTSSVPWWASVDGPAVVCAAAAP